MNLSLRQLKAFVGVAQTSSFTKTAQRLHMSQAALSAIIRELETQLRCRLFDRTTRSVTLTEAGRAFLPTALQTVEALESSAATLGALGREEQSSIRVGVTPTIAASLMPLVLQRAAEVSPQMQVEVTDRAPEELHRLVEEGDLDAAFGAFFREASGIDRRPLFPTRLMRASALDAPAAAGADGNTEVSWASFQDATLICLSEGNPIQRLVDQTLAASEVVPARRIPLTHIESTIAMAEHGFGVAVVPSFCVRTAQRFQVRMELIRPVVEFSYYCITRAGRGPSAALDALVAAFTEVGAATLQQELPPGRRRKRPA
ncbi:LysR family transcriptional regulator [Aquabacterium sp. A7-Y]|uniref:LysR family transcriptional regulator n=1 Tax=Aquabacterium sp. A7-Y TaxID=1349605 RepID=UPI00223CCD77|nr:LysR family transcriptional regulator [Aquabacterium sp. A7-Y]MCW7538818.1 LysR family transcriptional regulator [Aquabacterium sp. A7-Y]